jgi:hypothetical protein
MSELCPITLRTAQGFVREHHRHNDPQCGHKFSIGLTVDGVLVGVVTVGRPIARAYEDGFTAEVTRCCVLDGQRNANPGSPRNGVSWGGAVSSMPPQSGRRGRWATEK